MKYWQLIGRAWRLKTAACTRCDSHYVRLSRRRAGLTLRLLGLVLFRCESCGRLCPLPRRLRATVSDSPLGTPS